MKNRLHKSSLKVLGFDFSSGRQLLERLHTNDARRYPLDGGVRLSVFTNQGTLHVQTAPGFVFDGRSGPKIVDWYAPNLGNLYEILCWFVHDCNGYGQDLSFKDTNILLYAMLRDLADYRPTKCAVIQLAQKDAEITRLQAEKYADHLNRELSVEVCNLKQRVAAIEVAEPLREQILNERIACVQNTLNRLVQPMIPNANVAPGWGPAFVSPFPPVPPTTVTNTPATSTTGNG